MLGDAAGDLRRRPHENQGLLGRKGTVILISEKFHVVLAKKMEGDVIPSRALYQCAEGRTLLFKWNHSRFVRPMSIRLAS